MNLGLQDLPTITRSGEPSGPLILDRVAWGGSSLFLGCLYGPPHCAKNYWNEGTLTLFLPSPPPLPCWQPHSSVPNSSEVVIETSSKYDILKSRSIKWQRKNKFDSDYRSHGISLCEAFLEVACWRAGADVLLWGLLSEIKPLYSHHTLSVMLSPSPPPWWPMLEVGGSLFHAAAIDTISVIWFPFEKISL